MDTKRFGARVRCNPPLVVGARPPAAPMLSKHKRPYDPDALRPEKRLRANVQDLFASNVLPAARVQELYNDIARCGVGGQPAKPPTKGMNSHRGLRRCFLKCCMWPSLYWADVRTFDQKKNSVLKTPTFCLPSKSPFCFSSAASPFDV